MTRLHQLNISDSDDDTFHSIVMDTFDTACSTKVRIGGKYIPNCFAMDGQKYVCMDELMMDVKNHKCVVYSFGIGSDWTFENTMASFGCKVYAYDHTIHPPKFVPDNITFANIGLSDVPYENDDDLKTLSQIIEENGHTDTKISYLKMDIEGTELHGLPMWLDSGSFANVQQIAIEYHLRGVQDYLRDDFLKALRDLHTKEDFRIFSWEANNCFYSGRSDLYYELAEIVLKKVTGTTNCI